MDPERLHLIAPYETDPRRGRPASGLMLFQENVSDHDDGSLQQVIVNEEPTRYPLGKLVVRVRQSATDQPFSDQHLGVGRSPDRRDTHHPKPDAGVAPVEFAALLTTRVREISNHCPVRAANRPPPQKCVVSSPRRRLRDLVSNPGA